MDIAIVDDVAQERLLLKERLQTQLQKKHMHADFYEYNSGEAFLTASKQHTFTVAFLDIYMDRLNGIDTAKELRKYDKDCLLIFTTTSTDHALDGFRVRAMHYLVKPYTETEIALLIDEILARIPSGEKCIEISSNGSSLQIPFDAVIYAEHFSHVIHIHTTQNKVLTTRQSFGDFTAPLLTESCFFICNRGVMINLAHAIDFDGTSFILDNQDSIPVSRKLVKNARQVFMDFLFQNY